MKPWMALARSRIASSLSICLFLYSLSSGATESTIRVRMQRLHSPVSISGLGLRYSNSSSSGDLGFRALKISWVPWGAGVFGWKIADRDTGRILANFRAKRLDLEGLNIRINLKSVPDHVTLTPPTSRSLDADAIASVNLEEYLRGVVPSEMPKAWPIEALKAQAVAARTYALYRKQERSGYAFDVEADVNDQVFINPLGLNTGKVESNAVRAVLDTKGEVLFDGQGRILASFFHADCGGRTEEARDVWGSGERQGTAVDDSCPLNPASRWKAVFKRDELTARLRAFAPRASGLAGLETVGRTPSGRIAKLRLVWTDATTTLIGANEFRLAVGHDRIRSTNFELSALGDRLDFSGRGYGHGAGMCQWGAKNMARNGAFYSEILQHYYPYAVIKEPTRL